HVLPPSSDSVVKIFPCRVRPRACSLPPACVRMLGWMAESSLPSPSAGVACQVLPRSAVRSKWTRQPSCSVLLGQRRSPPGNCTGLVLIGPRVPSGRRRASDQVLPPSSEVFSMPHQERGLGPTL